MMVKKEIYVNYFIPRHRLGTPNEAFFHRNPELLGFGRHIGQINSRALGYFRPNYQHPFWYSESTFSIIQPLLLHKTKPLYPHPKYLFGIGI